MDRGMERNNINYGQKRTPEVTERDRERETDTEKRDRHSGMGIAVARTGIRTETGKG